MNEKYCVACGFLMDLPDSDLVSICYGCTAFSTKSVEFLTTWVPATCGDDVCFTDFQGMPNLDGDCSHYEDFYAVMDNY
jgi:hypothetical protein